MIHKMDVLNLVISDPNVSTGAFAVFYRLVHHYNTTNGKCFPSEKTIADAIQSTERTVRTHLRALAKAGHIIINRNASRHGTNLYDLPAMSGKIVCSPSETLGKKPLPEISSKPLKKNSKDNSYRVEAQSALESGVKPLDLRQNAKKEAQLEAAMVGALGGGGNGYEKLLTLPPGIMEEATRRHLMDGVSRVRVVEEAMEKIRELKAD
jgi:hypothetical protein